MNEHTFQDGDRVRVVPRPYESGDRHLANKLAVIVEYSHYNSVDEVYRVDVEGEEGYTLLYARDMVKETALTLEQRKAKLEAELLEVQREIENSKQEGVISEWPVGSSLRIKDTLYIKVDEDKWHWIYIGNGDYNYHSNSTDKSIVLEMREARRNGWAWTTNRADRH